MMVSLLQQLIRIPSENNGVTGYEYTVQHFYFNWLRDHGISAELIDPETIPGFDQNPGRLKEHSIHMRPSVIAGLEGNRPGKTLLLLAHADTVPVGPLSDWNDSPFSGKIEDGRIYGRGSGDDKWGMALMAALMVELKKSHCDFPGKLIIAAVADEESGGANGTAAVFAHGVKADEAIYLDGGSNLTIWHAGLGGGFCRISGGDPAEVRRIIRETKDEIRRKIDASPYFGPDFFRIIEKQFYLISETQTRIGFFHDTLPGEDEAELKTAFERKLPGCTFTWMSRFLKPAVVPKDSPLVQNLIRSFRKAAGKELPAVGGVQSDQGIVMMLGKIPCILFGCGRRGVPGASHLPNEFIEIANLETVYRTVLDYLRSNG